MVITQIYGWLSGLNNAIEYDPWFCIDLVVASFLLAQPVKAVNDKPVPVAEVM